jgi:NADH:ubiquinone oxidoreductase subunit C
MDGEALLQTVTGLGSGAERREKTNLPAVSVPLQALLALMGQLRDDPRLAFDLLLDHTAIDWIEQDQFELLYTLYSTVQGHTLLVTCRVPRGNPVAPTVSALWPTALWQEREAFDLLGILYDDHPDLRRLFLEDDWVGHPLRKDYKDEYMLRDPR